MQRRTMMWLEILATVVFVVAGIALLFAPPAQAQTVSFSPTRFTVVDAGTAGKPDVVLIPGLGSSRAVWDAEAKLLAPNYRLHLLQVAGFAGAPVNGNADGAMLPGMVEELHSYLAAAKMKPVVVGHSLGGLLALMLADKYPGDVRKLVIVDTLPYYAVLFNPAATVETMTPMAATLKGQIIAVPADQFDLMQTTVTAQLVKNEDGRKAVAAADSASDRTVFATAMYEDLLTDLRAEVGSIKTPALLLYPYDATMPGAEQAKVDALYKDAYKPMPNVKLVRVDDSRHFIMYDQPGRLDAELEAFLK